MKVAWSPEAIEDRLAIWDYVAADNPIAAIRLDALFGAAAQRLSDHPKLGRPGQIVGTRELIPHESYRIVYEIDDGVLWILAVVHTARMWPPLV